MEKEKLCPEIGEEQNKASSSRVKKLCEGINPFLEFLPFHRERPSSKKSWRPSDNLDEMLKNDLGNGMKSRKDRDELFDLFVEYWCTTMPMNLRNLIRDVERSVIIKILVKVNGNQRIAAKALGINTSTLNEKLKKHGIYFRKAPIVNG